MNPDNPNFRTFEGKRRDAEWLRLSKANARYQKEIGRFACEAFEATAKLQALEEQTTKLLQAIRLCRTLDSASAVWNVLEKAVEIFESR